MKAITVLFLVFTFVIYMAHRQDYEKSSEHHGQLCSDHTMTHTTLYKRLCPKDPNCDPSNPECYE